MAVVIALKQRSKNVFFLLAEFFESFYGIESPLFLKLCDLG